VPRHVGLDTLIVQAAEQLPQERSVGFLDRAYLDQFPQENQLDILLPTIVESLPCPRSATTIDDVIVLVLNQFEREFEDDLTVRVDGWLLAHTEARFYALTVSMRNA